MGNDIIDVQTTADVPVIADDQIVALAERAEKRIDAVNRLKRLALRVTGRHDWVDQQGKPYLQVSGAEKVARLFGISWQIDEPVYEQEPDGHFSYTYKGTFSLTGATIEAIGSRSSRDGFFSRGGKLPTAEIDKGDIKKAAYTNCIGSGVTRLLGIRNMTWDDLAEAGISTSDVSRVSYKRAGQQTDTHIASSDAAEKAITVVDVRKMNGKNEKTGKPWTKFTVKALGGGEYTTFSETFALKAKEAKEAGRNLKVTYKATQYGNDIESLVFADDGPGGEES